MSTDNNENRNSAGNIPENDPSKAMDSKKEVDNANDEKIDQDFPGYPHYPAREDIFDKRNDYIRENVDVENLPNSKNLTGVSQRFSTGGDAETDDDVAPAPPATDEGDLGIQMGNEADVTPDELKALEDTEYLPTADEDMLRTAKLDNTDFDGDELNEESFGEKLSGDDLDIPEETDETATTSMGQGDEENKYYSLGSDDNDNVVEGTP